MLSRTVNKNPKKKTPKNTKKTLLTTKEDPLKSNARLCRALLASKN
jgi:hypothetical protein